nr:MAG TPA: hypothetical protein [Caudoviricetes sp.]
MKLELQCGDTITIPKGCKAIIKDGSVVFEKEQGFKDGDVLCRMDSGLLLIFKEAYGHDRGLFNSYYNTGPWDNKGWYVDVFRHATEEEKQLLFDKMKEQGLKWNAEEKQVERIRWRAKKGECYYFTDSIDASVMSNHEADDKIDYLLWNAYNYFRTEEQAEEAAKRVKETLKKYCEEIGE